MNAVLGLLMVFALGCVIISVPRPRSDERLFTRTIVLICVFAALVVIAWANG